MHSRFRLVLTLAASLAVPAAALGAPEDEVLAAVGRYERAIQTGDPRLYCALQVEAERAGQICQSLRREGFTPRPDFTLVREGVLVRGRTAAAFTRMGRRADAQYMGLLFVREGGEWRLLRQKGSSTPLHRPAFCPPEGGRFLAAGAPWDRVASHPVETGAAGQLLQAAADESFLYVRVTAPADLPPPGSIVPDLDRGAARLPALPRLAVHVGGPGAAPRRFSVEMDTGVGSRLADGKQTVRLSYSFSVSAADLLFFVFAGPDASLFEVTARHVVARVPLESLGADERTALTLDLGRPSRPRVEPQRF